MTDWSGYSNGMWGRSQGGVCDEASFLRGLGGDGDFDSNGPENAVLEDGFYLDEHVPILGHLLAAAEGRKRLGFGADGPLRKTGVLAFTRHTHCGMDSINLCGRRDPDGFPGPRT